MKSITIRTAEEKDYDQVYGLLKEAFKNDEQSAQNEAEIVASLKRSKLFNPEFSFIAVIGQKIIGYLLLTPVTIESPQDHYEVLALAPVAVLPSYQQQGVGSALIKHAHRKATLAKYPLIVLIGHDTYYPRFGYEEASTYDIQVPFDIPSQFVMVKELKENAGKDVHGLVRYPASFYL